jgi:EAL domain-containing protein (putative c-di-GMP-specific phosphodiesterase class I)
LSINASSELIAKQQPIRSAALPLAARKRLVTEITEQSQFDSYDFYRHLVQLRQLEIRYAADDLGSAHSNVFRVASILPDILKIDNRMTSNLTTDHVHRAVVECIVSLGRGIRAQTVAEGIETRDDMLWAASLGVNYAQGYYLGRPAPIEEWFPDGDTATSPGDLISLP